jgi:DNA-binding PadR family transcriptional regulator
MGDTLGGFEKLLLLAILRLGEGAYGAAVFEELEARTGREVSPGAVYVALRRLEAKGMVRSRRGEASPERGGRAKRHYMLREEGLEALRAARREWEALADGLEGVLGREA